MSGSELLPNTGAAGLTDVALRQGAGVEVANLLKVSPEAGFELTRADDMACHVVIVTTSIGAIKLPVRAGVTLVL